MVSFWRTNLSLLMFKILAAKKIYILVLWVNTVCNVTGSKKVKSLLCMQLYAPVALPGKNSWYPLNRWTGIPQNWSGYFKVEMNLMFLLKVILNPSGTVSIMTELSQLPVLYVVCVTSTQTLPNLHSSYILEQPVQVIFCACQKRVYTRPTMHVYTRKSSRNPCSSTLKPEWPQHDRPATCAINLQYSSTTSISLHSHSHTEKFSAYFKYFTILKLHKSKIL
jgi:hypothetical protein